MIDLAFVILAHKGPQQVHRLIERLQGHRCYLHIDSAVNDPGSFATRSTILLPRKRTGWGGWGLVEAELVGLEHAIRDGATHVALLTGQDYPIRPISDLVHKLEADRQRSYLFHRQLPSPIYGKDGGLGRFYYWHRRTFGKRFRVPLRRRPPIELTPHSGFQLFVMHAALAQWLIDFTRNHPKVCNYFEHTWIPDELFIATVMQHSPLLDEVSNELLWHTQWEPGAAHPKVFTMADLTAIREAADKGAFFARKFDMDIDPNVLDALDDDSDSDSKPVFRDLHR